MRHPVTQAIQGNLEAILKLIQNDRPIPIRFLYCECGALIDFHSQNPLEWVVWRNPYGQIVATHADMKSLNWWKSIPLNQFVFVAPETFLKSRPDIVSEIDKSGLHDALGIALDAMERQRQTWKQ